MPDTARGCILEKNWKLSKNRQLRSHQLNGNFKHQFKMTLKSIISLAVAHWSRERAF